MGWPLIYPSWVFLSGVLLIPLLRALDVQTASDIVPLLAFLLEVVLPGIAYILVVYSDLKALEHSDSDYDTSGLLLWGILIAPVYLWKRSKRTGMEAPRITGLWFVALLLPILLVILAEAIF